MNVKEIITNLQKLVEQGHGDLELYAIHGASGVSYTVDIYDSVSVKEGNVDGALDEEDDGFKYIPVYAD